MLTLLEPSARVSHECNGQTLKSESWNERVRVGDEKTHTW